MALVKNDTPTPSPPAHTAAVDNDETTSQPNSTYQALLMERGRLVCETRVCATAHEAAVAMLDYTACQVGEVLSQARKTLRDGRADTETVFCARQIETGVGCAAGAQTNGFGSANGSGNEEVVGSAESIVIARHKPWGHSPSGRRRGTPDEETYAVRQRDDGKKVNKAGEGCPVQR